MRNKAARGIGYVHTWTPAKLPAAAPAPTYTLRHPAGDVSVAMAPIHASVSVTATDGTQALTLSAPVADAAGITGDAGGRAWLDLGAAGRFPVRVLRFVDPATVELANPLPYSVPTTATGTLRWNTWEAVLSAAQIGADTVRSVRWDIDWTLDAGADRNARPMRTSGLLAIVPTPFATNITDDDVAAAAPPLAALVPPEQTGYAPQRRQALESLAGWIAAGLPSPHTEDDVAGGQFATAHALLTAAYVLRAHDAVGYDRASLESLISEAQRLTDEALKSIDWLDDGDGVVDPGEGGGDSTSGSGSGYVAIAPRSHMSGAAGTEPSVWPPVGFRRASVNEEV